MIYPQFVLRLIGALLKLTGDSKGHAKDISALVLIHVTNARTHLTVQMLVTFLISANLETFKIMNISPTKSGSECHVLMRKSNSLYDML